MAILAPISPEALAVRYGAAILGCATVFCPNSGDRSRLRQFLGHVRADVLVVFPETAGAAAQVMRDGLVGSVMSVGGGAGDRPRPAGPKRDDARRSAHRPGRGR